MGRTRRTYRHLLAPSVAAAVYLAVAAYPPVWDAVLGWMFPDETRLLYPVSMITLIGQHLAMVAVSSIASVLVGVGLGVFVTRPIGADYFDTVSDIANLAQTFPPIAVLTLAVPFLGLGFKPTVFALTLYGILPVLQNTIQGLVSVPAPMLESAQAMGLTPRQSLWRMELPWASPVILAGVRVSVVINVSTATIGAIVGAGGLGAPIISGLANSDPAVTIQGAVLAAGLALILDAYLAASEGLLGRGGARTEVVNNIER